ncbi:unnamed protein product [Trichobilharzia szidati]|nr:unnamed protein product [Trichobilharzia szidati]
MEFPYPSAYSTPTTLSNSQGNSIHNNNNNTTAVSTTSTPPITLTTSTIIIKPDASEHYKTTINSLDNNKPPENCRFQQNHDNYLKSENPINFNETAFTNCLIPNETDDIKPLDSLEISPQLYLSESSSSLEPACNLMNDSSVYYGEQTTSSTDWLSQLFQTSVESTSYETTLSKTCISPSWKNHEYVHYSYTNSTPDLNIPRHYEQQQQQQEPMTLEAVQGVQFPDVTNYEALEKSTPSTCFYGNISQNSECFETIRMKENIDVLPNISSDNNNVQPLVNMEEYTPILPMYNITNNLELSNHVQNKLESNTDCIKLPPPYYYYYYHHHHQNQNLNQNPPVVVVANGEEQIFPCTLNNDNNNNDNSQLIQTNAVSNFEFRNNNNHNNKTQDEDFFCRLCSLENSPQAATNSTFNNSSGMNSFWANYRQVLDNNIQPRFENNISNNFQQQQQLHSSPLLNLSRFRPRDQCVNGIEHLIPEKRKLNKKRLDINPHENGKLMPLSTTLSSSTSTSSRNSSKSMSLFQISPAQLNTLLPPISCNEISRILHRYQSANIETLFQTIRIDNLSSGKSSYPESVTSTRGNQIVFRLREQKIWSDICVHNTEMIATNTGRRIFPSLSVDVFGLSPAEEYIFLIDMLLIQPHIFKHQGDRWVVSCQSEELITHSQSLQGRYYIQEESPKTGAYWMESGVNFTRVKITNSKDLKSHKNMIQVHSMHYYIPRISVVRLNRVNGTHSMNYPNHNNNNHSQYNSSVACLPQSDQLELIGAYIIPGTQFYTVTAYQNPDVIRIKINNNPFAKGFRNRQDQDELNDMAMLSAMNIKSKYMMMMMTTQRKKEHSPPRTQYHHHHHRCQHHCQHQFFHCPPHQQI